MFEDEIVPGTAAARVASTAHARSYPDSLKPSPLEEEVVSLFDQMQDGLLRLFQHLQRGKPRHAQRNRQTLLRYGAASAEIFFLDHAPNPEDQLARTQRQVRLHAVLQALPEQDRQCLALRAEGLTYREISRVLDMPLGCVSLSLGRSLARFARAEER